MISGFSSSSLASASASVLSLEFYIDRGKKMTIRESIKKSLVDTFCLKVFDPRLNSNMLLALEDPLKLHNK